MKAYVMTTGTVFGLLVLVHIWRFIEEGAALAASVIEHLLDTGALIIVTTHLSALKSFAVNDARIVNASMEFDSATGQPTYRMITGIPGRSRAKHHRQACASSR